MFEAVASNPGFNQLCFLCKQISIGHHKAGQPTALKSSKLIFDIEELCRNGCERTQRGSR